MSARIIITPAGKTPVIANVVSDAFGHFRIGLRPGRYVLLGTNLTGARYPKGTSLDVEVSAGRFTSVELLFDSGIRYQGQA